MSERKIAKQLGISRQTVSKYLKLTAAEMMDLQATTDRNKKLDDYREYIIHLLQTYPGLPAVKVLRKLKAKQESLLVSDRSVRRYIQRLKQEISIKQQRYYEPVLDMAPGEQCQVDGGELRGVMIGGVETTVYFMVFVLSYSRLMHVSVSDRPIDTETFIQQRCCKLFNRALTEAKSKIRFWRQLRGLFLHSLIPDWEALYRGIADGLKPVVIPYNTS